MYDSNSIVEIVATFPIASEKDHQLNTTYNWYVS